MKIILDFIYKYTWMVMLILIYIIWGVYSIKDIIETVRMYRNSFDLDNLDESTKIWVSISFILTFLASFLYWLACTAYTGRAE